MMVFRPNRPDSQMSRSASIATAIRASLGRVLNQSVKTSTGVLGGIPASHGLQQLLSAVCRDQFNVQWSREPADFQHVEAKNGTVFVHLFHDLIMSRFTEVAFLLLKHDFEEVPLVIVPDCYVLVLGHKIMPFLMESVR
jgi:hypothetical protein